jgi:hypothetical protein
MGISREYKGPEDLLNFEESKSQKEERHKREEGEHIKQFMDMQICTIKSGYEATDGEKSGTGLDDYMRYFWQPNYSTKFRELFREERDAEENKHLDIWEEIKDDSFKEALMQKILGKLYKDKSIP